MHGRGRQRGVVGFEAAGVDDPRGTGFRDGSDLLGVLAVAVGQVGARDQHEHIHRRNGGGVIVVDDRGVHPSGGVVNDLGQVAGTGDHLGGVGAAVEDGFDGCSAEVTGGNGDDDGHRSPFRFRRWSVADGACAMQVAALADLIGGEGGDAGAGDREAELVGAEEPDRIWPFGAQSLGAMNRTIVQSSPEDMIWFDMPVISS